VAVVETSRKILELLERDACLTPDKIAVMLGEDVAAIQAEIHRLERDRVIIGRKALINWEKAGDEQVWALIEVRVSPQREVGFNAVANRISRFPETWSVYLLSGTYELAVQVVGRSMREVASFVAEKLAPLDGVEGTTTHFLMKRYKDRGVVFEDQEEVERLPITP
jgi:DNA-binding Lrp family transcriptional regulator